MWPIIYAYLIFPLFYLAVRLSTLRNLKNRASVAGRINLWPRIALQLANRDQKKPLIWFHVASAGEYLQAMPVAERLIKHGYQIALTVTSVSGYQWAMKRRAQIPELILIDYLPFDTRSNMQKLLKLLKPEALIFVKFDLWPNLIWQANKFGVKQFLISATLHEKSKRVTSAAARSLYNSIYSCLDGIFAVSERDKQRFLATCPRHRHIVNAGDTRFDSVLDRRDNLKPPKLPIPLDGRTILVVGSCWPEDEQHIFPVLQASLARHQKLVCIIAPHETDEKHLRNIEQAFSSQNCVRFSKLDGDKHSDNNIILVDTVGHLSSLYTYADIAYIGGAFGRGVHNTMEPTAMGVPAIFGPFYQNSPEAIELIANQKSFTITDEIEFENIFLKLLNNPEQRKALGASAKQFIENQAGASDTCVTQIEEMLK